MMRILNTVRMYKEDWRASIFYRGITENSGKASDCIKCGQCEGVCPQHLSIIELLAELSEHYDKNKKK